MARKIKDSTLDSKEGRRQLKPRGKPYYRTIEQRLHLGYRRLRTGAGTWIIRHYVGDRKYAVEKIGIADDLSDADGIEIFDYWAAVEEVRKRRKQRALDAAGIGNSPTVRTGVVAYIKERDARESRRRGRKVRSDAGQRLSRYLLGQEKRGNQPAIVAHPLAAKELRKLSEGDLSAWRKGLPDAMKESSRQRLVNDLRAALNAAYAEHRRHLDPALPSIIKHGLKAKQSNGQDEAEPLARDNQILSDAKITRLLRAAQQVDADQEWNGDLYRLVVVLAATGARFSQVARMRVADYQRRASRLMVPTSRKGKGAKAPATPVPVGKDTLDALVPAVTGRAHDAPLLERWRHKQVVGGNWERDGRGPWQPSEIARPWETIRTRARLPEVIPYALRHSSIVRGIRAGLPIRLVAALHDTSVQMIERHYARWIVDGLEQLAAKAVVPLLPSEGAGRVVALARSA